MKKKNILKERFPKEQQSRIEKASCSLEEMEKLIAPFSPSKMDIIINTKEHWTTSSK